MTMGPEPMSRIFFRSVRRGMSERPHERGESASRHALPLRAAGDDVLAHIMGGSRHRLAASVPRALINARGYTTALSARRLDAELEGAGDGVRRGDVVADLDRELVGAGGHSGRDVELDVEAVILARGQAA